MALKARWSVPGVVRLAVTVAYLAASFVWLGYEDLDRRYVTALGAGLPLLAGLRGLEQLSRRGLRFRQRIVRLVLGGGALGLAVGPLTALLMAAKVSLHGHTVPDFQPADVAAVLRSSPAWGFAGLLLGGAAALLAWRGEDK